MLIRETVKQLIQRILCYLFINPESDKFSLEREHQIEQLEHEQREIKF